MTNNVNVQFPEHVLVSVQALSNSAAEQTVTITPPPPGRPAIFRGHGEHNSALKLVDPGFLTASSGQPYFTALAGKNYNVKMTHNGSGANSVQNSQLIVSTPANGYYGVTSVISEDASDQDFNDAAVIMTWWRR